MKRNSFVIMDETGTKKIFDTLLTFDNDDTGKHYIVYTDYRYDKKGNVEVYASTYDVGPEGMHLSVIETKKEWELVERILKVVQIGFREGIIKHISREKNTNARI